MPRHATPAPRQHTSAPRQHHAITTCSATSCHATPRHVALRHGCERCTGGNADARLYERRGLARVWARLLLRPNQHRTPGPPFCATRTVCARPRPRPRVHVLKQRDVRVRVRARVIKQRDVRVRARACVIKQRGGVVNARPVAVPHFVRQGGHGCNVGEVLLVRLNARDEQLGPLVQLRRLRQACRTQQKSSAAWPFGRLAVWPLRWRNHTRRCVRRLV